MSGTRPKVYVFGWPSFLGGADTKLAHLIPLLHREFELTLIPNHPKFLRDRPWIPYLKKFGVKYTSIDALPEKLEGFALGMCNSAFFRDRIAHRAKSKGLKIIWSSEMMWHHEGEEEAAKTGLIDKVLYVSELQKKYLSKAYGDLPWHMTGNYIDPAFFPFKERRHKTFAIGRLSRPDPVKFPEDFPVFYERLELPDTRFRVMAWNKELARKYRWHKFDARWDLLPAEKEPQVKFLHSLDLFVYPLGHFFRESWGRSTVEAMLTGCVPLVPPGHHLDQLIVPGESGFICSDFLEYQEHARRLYHDVNDRNRLSRQCREHAVNRICVAAEHLKMWREVFQ